MWDTATPIHYLAWRVGEYNIIGPPGLATPLAVALNMGDHHVDTGWRLRNVADEFLDAIS